MGYNVESLDERKKDIFAYWFKEMYPVRGMEPASLWNVFSKTQVCSCCGERGWVPKDHRFLCIFCYVTNRFEEREPDIPDNEKGWVRGDYPKVPAGIEGCNWPPDGHVVYTITYPVEEMSDEELRKLIPSLNS